MYGSHQNDIPELLEKIDHLRKRASTDDDARQKLTLLRRVLTCTMMGTVPASGLTTQSEDAIL